MPRTAIAQVVAVHRRNHHVFQAQIGNRGGQVTRLVHIQRPGPTVPDIAERTAPRTDIAHDHEGRRAPGETLPQVWTRGFLADAVQLVLTQQRLDSCHLGRGGDLHADPVRFAWHILGGQDLHRNPRHLVGATQLHPCLHSHDLSHGSNAAQRTASALPASAPACRAPGRRLRCPAPPARSARNPWPVARPGSGQNRRW